MSLSTAAALAAAVLFFSTVAGAAKVDAQRRFPMELQVLAGDARMLAHAELPAARRRGLTQRIAGSLSGLRLLARQYRQAARRSAPALLSDIDALRRDFAHGRWDKLARRSRILARGYPPDLSALRPAQASADDVRRGRRLYRHLCMGCHAHPDPHRDNPAPDLFAMAQRLPEREFISRLVTGVHGTPAVALHNPFSDSENAGLAAYLLKSTKNRMP